MSRKYGAGLQAIAATLVMSAVLCGLLVARFPGRTAPAAEDLGSAARPLGPFRLEERSGRTVTADDLADRVAIASFIFTRCPLSCPRISGIMQGVQARLEGTAVQLVSISVDPEHDTPQVLRKYAETYGASPDRWWFLTGPKAAIYDLIRDRFQLGVLEAPGPVGDDAEAILHSDRLALIDHGRIVGLFASTDPAALDSLIARARRRALPPWVIGLPTINAALNGLSAGLLFAGWVLIRRYRTSPKPVAADPHEPESLGSAWNHPMVRAHVTCMISAVCASVLFLACYLYYHYRAGSMAFAQGGPIRIVYLSILLSHTLLATCSFPLILVTIRRAWTGSLDRHVSIASFTLPIWLYVGVTGVVIYLMLYHLPPPPVAASPGI